ncbi:MAG: glycosyltransferase family 4 protein [Leptolyngbya sp. UWPOB_LEPTO1]|uniref:glycosyltransferase family 4 protein n=1 Tax=Leptolyngbya sp. UWPOB_LEPTO1 TaxID=2815653 RepID=UPI001AC14835|nr:glycosyltransferase family 4 protein [Leptolyngbya sp. UWPOB_LEPTO1]MBN8560366.1 glycosyltransferase family 4 protein [Leptolyngbya sp. UWPOB_LEPTO1]
MNVLLMSNSDLWGGAARAAYRLHQGLKQAEINSQMLVQFKYSSDPTVVSTHSNAGIGHALTSIRLPIDNLPLKFYPNKKTSFSLQWLPNLIARQVYRYQPDIINLHWTHFGYLSIETLAKLRRPLIWTLHDMWALTGGCHYTQGCDRFQQGCGQCPQLDSKQDWDLSRWVWQRKAKAWKNLDLTIVTPSRWLAECAKESPLLRDFQIECIPNGIDTALYRPIEKLLARKLLQLPPDKILILSGAFGGSIDQRKGTQLLQPALRSLSQSEWGDQIEIVFFGADLPMSNAEMGFKSHGLGALNDDLMLALAYSAADLFVAPSLQDNLPNTVLEAMACGTPCVGFNVGGMSDLIDHQQNGYLAVPFQPDDFARGIKFILMQKDNSQKLGQNAREKVEREFHQELQAARYSALFDTRLATAPKLNVFQPFFAR